MAEESAEELRKKVDETWKEAVSKEKDTEGASGEEQPEATFSLFISGLMMEGLIALGAVENPVTKKKEMNKGHAKFIIDTLGMLKEKTNNNLSKDELNLLDSILYELRTHFISTGDASGGKIVT